MNKSRTSGAWKEIVGVALCGLGILLFLALVSYDARDVPSWVFLINTTSKPNAQVHNLIGVVGSIFGGYSYFFLGAASYLLSMFLVGLGLGKLFVRGFSLPDRIGWAVLNLISAACLAQLLYWLFPGWQDHFGAHGPGGWIGEWVGGKAFRQALGTVGSVIVLMALYLISLILSTGFHPIHFARVCFGAIKVYVQKVQAQRLARMTDEQRIEEAQKALSKEAELLEKQLKKSRKQKKAEFVDGEIEVRGQDDLQPESARARKIIDASVPKKPTLDEIKAAQGKKKGEALEGLSQVQCAGYQLPPLELLEEADPHGVERTNESELLGTQNVIVETLQYFGIDVQAGDITKGPTITRYELYPARGVRVDRIVSLERDIARATKAERINILAPIPGKDTVGVELANSQKVKVTLRELFNTKAWIETKARLPLALGKDVYGNTIIADLAQMPHCLVAGTTGSGKSVCINAIIASLLYRFSPEDLRFIMIDPKVVEMQHYNKLPHLVTPVVTDPKKVLLALRWVVDEMELRYKIFAKTGVRNIASFNGRPKPKTQMEMNAAAAVAENKAGLGDHNGVEEDGVVGEVPKQSPPPVRVPRDDELVIPERLPYIVVIIDELADLMQTAPADVEMNIARITQMARAAGIHMIVATQTPRADVVTGIIKANIPSRIAFQVASKIDSRVILDENGAEKLLGQGDMLYLPPGTSGLIRSQGVLVTDDEIRRIVDFVSNQSEPVFEPSIHQKLSSPIVQDDVNEGDEELIEKCLEIIRQEKKASTSMLQRRLRLGYTRAARVVDILEQRGILGPKDGARDREILIDLEEGS